jgi:hypothetical protein
MYPHKAISTGKDAVLDGTTIGARNVSFPCHITGNAVLMDKYQHTNLPCIPRAILEKQKF